MGPVGTVTQTEYCSAKNLEATQRTKDIDYRRKITRKIRESMNRIKRDLGLLEEGPTTTAGGASTTATPTDSPPRVEDTDGARDISAVAGKPAPTDDGGGDAPQQQPRLSTRTTNAARSISSAITQSLIRSGSAYTSFMDGTVHSDWRKLDHYHAFCLPLLEAALVASGSGESAVARAKEFATSGLAAATKEEYMCRMQLDAARKQRDVTYMSSFYLSSPTNSDAAKDAALDEPISDDDLQALELAYVAFRQSTATLRSEYNSKAEACATNFFKIDKVRSLDLAAQYRAANPPNK
jgi:hypothetical protein